MNDVKAVVASGEEDSLSEKTYLELRKLLLSNQLKQGARLTYADVADRLSVSRTPVREALERLRQEGYVTRVPRRGFLVADMDATLARSLYQMRESLEPFALGVSMSQGISATTLRSLDKMVELYGELVRKGEIARRREADREFHLTLAALCGNDYLVRVLTEVFDKLLLKFRIEGYYHVERGPKATEEHAELLAAIRSGNSSLAQKMLRNHIRAAGLGFDRFLRMNSVAQ